MEFIKKNGPGLLVCLAITLPAFILGKLFPIVGGPIFAILIGMIICPLLKNRDRLDAGISFTSKKILQSAVVLLGFGLNLGVIAETGRQSLPIIVCTITTSLVVAYLLHRAMKTPGKISMLIGVGSSICGGSAVAATASVIDADDEEIAQSISVIFFFNVIAAIIFPQLGYLLGFDTTSGDAFGIFAGTAVNDTSSVTATAATWDSMWNLGTATLDKAVTVKLTRTLAIIPITLVIAFMRSRKLKKAGGAGEQKVSMAKIFPMFILYFILASVITTVAMHFGAPASVFTPLKELSKIFIIMAMAAIGLNTDIIKLIKTGGKPIFMGLCCWISISAVSLILQHVMGIW
ncbi:YeiH family protein [Aminicella lysinilytica]|uniref:Putative integral membrane protein (TIGR00698 family) n=1 Tax=Aminicella lysinilytica TaxID=433323 RepID=A0A4R6PXF7_9FIRM|nr:YeiH family protein [Aminicella lysinilytica]NLD10339.1 YeiH family putative sulfate export transporter [Clostridiales bacterium]TDP50359.1 putative integral membrane protein (TIGR00698 family) [Aminicella lysinilytica]